MRITFKFTMATIPSLLSWNIISLIVAMTNDIAALAAFTLIMNFIEISVEVFSALGYTLKIAMSHFIVKKDTQHVKKLIHESM